MTVSELMELFFIGKEFQGLSLKTLKWKRSVLASFQFYCFEKELHSLQSTMKDILMFLENEYRRDRSIFLYNRRLGTLSQWYDFLVLEKKVLTNPCGGIERINIEYQPGPVFSVEDMKALLSVIPDTPLGRRDRAVIELLYSTGMRVGECVGLDCDDVNLKDREVVIRGTKTGRDRVVPVGESALMAIERYLETDRFIRKGTDPDPLFLSRKGGRPTTACIHFMVNRYKEKANITTPGNVHAIRRACATHMTENGAPAEVVARLLGHKDLSTLPVYTQIKAESWRNFYG